MIVALWDGALSCRRNQSPDSHLLDLTRRILFRSLSITPLQYATLLVWSSRSNSLWITLCKSEKKITKMFHTRYFWNHSFLFSVMVRFLRHLQRTDVFSGRIVGETPCLIASYSFVKELNITVCCGDLISAGCNYPVVMLWSQNSVEQSAKKSSVFTNLQLKSFSPCPCQCSPHLLTFLAKDDSFEAATEKSYQQCWLCDILYTDHSWGRIQCLLVHHEMFSDGVVIGPHKLHLPFGEFPLALLPALTFWRRNYFF